ncbi:MAG: diguanylate cyclase, partial [Clostridium sp.]
MFTYIGRRIIQMIPVLLGVSMIIFFIISKAPGDFVDGKAGMNMTEEKKIELKASMDLDKPIPERYVRWMKKSFTGDFGYSLKFQQPVVKVIDTYVWNSFILAISAFIASILIAV